MTIAHPAFGERTITGLRRLLDGLLLALVVVSLGVVLLGRVLPLLGHQTLVVAGPSMGDAVTIGAVVVLDRVQPSSLAVGDVVSLRSGPDKAIFTHRIIRLADRDGGVWLETRGDANPHPDPSLTSAEAVLGRVSVAIPFVGYLVALYSAPSGIIFVVSLGMVLLLLGISLEPRPAVSRANVPSEAPEAPDAADGAARPPVGLILAPVAEPPIQVAQRSSTRDVVRASRERRARSVTTGSGSPRRRSRA